MHPRGLKVGGTRGPTGPTWAAGGLAHHVVQQDVGGAVVLQAHETNKQTNKRARASFVPASFVRALFVRAACVRARVICARVVVRARLRTDVRTDDGVGRQRRLEHLACARAREIYMYINNARACSRSARSVRVRAGGVRVLAWLRARA